MWPARRAHRHRIKKAEINRRTLGVLRREQAVGDERAFAGP